MFDVYGNVCLESTWRATPSCQVEAFLESLRFPVETKVHEPLTLDQKMQAQADEQDRAFILHKRGLW